MGLIGILMNGDVLVFNALLISLVFSLVLHEFAHGYVAYKCGDSTAYYQGRLTLNPLAHLDPVGSLMILFVGFGWAKPVPVNGQNLKKPRQDMIKIAIAGPATNFLLALLCVIVWKILLVMSVSTFSNPASPMVTFFYYFIYINLILGVFNMIPIPPLDGSRLLSFETQYRFSMYGPMVLFGLIILGRTSSVDIIGSVIGFFIDPIWNLFMLFLNL